MGGQPTVSLTNTRPVELSYTWETSTNARPQGEKKPDMSTSRIDKGSYFSRLKLRHHEISGLVWWQQSQNLSDRVETFDWRHAWAYFRL